jgi:hypothetical protein
MYRKAIQHSKKRRLCAALALIENPDAEQLRLIGNLASTAQMPF